MPTIEGHFLEGCILSVVPSWSCYPPFTFIVHAFSCTPILLCPPGRKTLRIGLSEYRVLVLNRKNCNPIQDQILCWSCIGIKALLIDYLLCMLFCAFRVRAFCCIWILLVIVCIFEGYNSALNHFDCLLGEIQVFILQLSFVSLPCYVFILHRQCVLLHLI
jgi:hypothetical protein